MESKDPVMHGVAVRKSAGAMAEIKHWVELWSMEEGPWGEKHAGMSTFKWPIVSSYWNHRGAPNVGLEETWAVRLVMDWEIQTRLVPSLEISRNVLSERNHEKSIKRGIIYACVCKGGIGYQTRKIQLDVYDLHL